MTRSTSVDLLLEERTRLIVRNATTEGHLFMAEVHLRRAAKYLREMIAPTPALAAARDTLCVEIDELLAEDRPHPAAILSDDSPGVEPVVGGEAGDPTPGGTAKAY